MALAGGEPRGNICPTHVGVNRRKEGRHELEMDLPSDASTAGRLMDYGSIISTLVFDPATSPLISTGALMPDLPDRAAYLVPARSMMPFWAYAMDAIGVQPLPYRASQTVRFDNLGHGVRVPVGGVAVNGAGFSLWTGISRTVHDFEWKQGRCARIIARIRWRGDPRRSRQKMARCGRVAFGMPTGEFRYFAPTGLGFYRCASRACVMNQLTAKRLHTAGHGPVLSAPR